MAPDPRRDDPVGSEPSEPSEAPEPSEPSGGSGGTVEAVAGSVAETIDEVVAEVADDVGDFVGRVRDDVLGREGYLIVLVMTILVVVAVPIDSEYRGGGIATASAVGLLVFTTMSRARVSHRLRVAAAVVIAGSFALAIAVTISDNRGEVHQHTWLSATFAATYTVMIALCFPAILRHAFGHHRISLNTVAAALSAYLMIGLIFTSLFRFVDIVAPPFFTQPHTNGFTFEYFSFITLSTVGFGDFTPANDAGRTLAMLEGVFGQIFLVTIVALVVSNLGVGRQQLRQTMAQGRGEVTPPDELAGRPVDRPLDRPLE
jgi:hypothetical protein